MTNFFDKILRRWSDLLYVGLGVLFLPALWFSVHTPFALIDDYNSWLVVRSFSTFQGINQWLSETFIFNTQRFRPVFELYNLATWELFRDNFVLHHLVRFALFVIPIFFFFKTLQLFPWSKKGKFNIPFFIFLCLYLFSSIQPEARLAPTEIEVVLLLSVLIYFFARIILFSEGNILASKMTYGILLACFWLLLWSKETALVPGAVFLLFAALFSFNNRKRLLAVLPFFAIFIYTLVKILALYQGGGYAASAITPELIAKNFNWYSKLVFQWFVSPVFTIAIVGCILGDFFQRFHSRLKSENNHLIRPPFFYRLQRWMLAKKETTFLIFIILLFLASFASLMTSWNYVSRYAFPSFYLLTFWVSFSSASLFSLVTVKYRWFKWGAVVIGIFFVLYNFNGFVYQFAVQSLTRVNENNMLQRVTLLLEQGQKISVSLDTEYEEKIRYYFDDYLPFYFDRNYPNIDFVKIPNQISFEKGSLYLTRNPNAPVGYRLLSSFMVETSSPLLRLSTLVSKQFWLAGQPPILVDNGVRKLGEINWFIFQNVSGDLTSAPYQTIETSTQNITLTGSGSDFTEYHHALSAPVAKDEIVQVYVEYSISGNASPFVILIDQSLPLETFYVEEKIPFDPGSHSAWVTFEPHNGELPSPLLILRNWSRTGTFTITRFEIRKLLIDSLSN